VTIKVSAPPLSAVVVAVVAALSFCFGYRRRLSVIIVAMVVDVVRRRSPSS